MASGANLGIFGSARLGKIACGEKGVEEEPSIGHCDVQLFCKVRPAGIDLVALVSSDSCQGVPITYRTEFVLQTVELNNDLFHSLSSLIVALSLSSGGVELIIYFALYTADLHTSNVGKIPRRQARVRGNREIIAINIIIPEVGAAAQGET